VKENKKFFWGCHMFFFTSSRWKEFEFDFMVVVGMIRGIHFVSMVVNPVRGCGAFVFLL
jgi:hypothetical protein